MKTRMLLAVMLVALAAGPVVADWNPGDGYKMHYPQLPDLDNGMNVLCTQPKLLADDWMCSATGYVTDIHIWGSWLGDTWPSHGLFVDMYIFEDVPADPAGGAYSHPGAVLWHQSWPGNLQLTMSSLYYEHPANDPEPFYNPNDNTIMGYDHFIIQYNFDIDPKDAFWQQEGTIYWLGVQRWDPEDDNVFGWKTSFEHWNDDAVYIDFFDPTGIGIPIGQGLEGWQELRAYWDPQLSLDLSFVITPEPATLMLVTLGGGLLTLLRRRRLTR